MSLHQALIRMHVGQKRGADFHIGFKLHARTGGEGYIEKLNTTPANVHEVNQLEPLVNDLEQGTRVEVDKGYSSAKNRKRLPSARLRRWHYAKGASRFSVDTRADRTQQAFI
ncbi:Transposase DDE domain [Oligella urethralis]|uniref:Transposase DDE domain n=1 Tax=Oligella urethralis TaxID=90245 RepID=A0A2X1UTP3_9BURK|nr:Transposase DDE domain [Oligella urethralis]SUA53447.1 Transposase DDE domain [Oligella urethralis]SUA65752.1 Transposase DDE domain [Oligella urethralis]SUA94740.1 Transposase DDE domain [Oligella urethralis]